MAIAAQNDLPQSFMQAWTSLRVTFPLPPIRARHCCAALALPGLQVTGEDPLVWLRWVHRGSGRSRNSYRRRWARGAGG